MKWIMDKQSEDARALRLRAEEMAKAAASPDGKEFLPPGEAQRVVHELQVNKIELEMQNEALRVSQAELAASRERYFELYDLAPVSYITINAHGLIRETNLTAAKRFAMDRKDLVKLPFSQLIDKEDLGLYYRWRDKVLETGMPQSCELRFERKDRTQFWGRLEAFSIREPSGSIVIWAVVSDTTEDRQAAEDLRQREELYRSLFTAHEAPMLILDPVTGQILAANAAAAAFYGWSVEGLMEMRIHQIDTLLAAEVDSKIRRARDTESLHFEVQHRTASGAIRDVEVFSSHVVISGKGLLYCIIHDISARKQVEKSLRESEALYLENKAITRAAQERLLLLDNIQIQIWLLTDDHTYGSVNQAHAVFLGLPKEEIIAKSPRELFPMARMLPFHESNTRVFETGNPERADQWVPHASGAWRLLSILRAPVLSEEGTVEYVVCSAEDITERRVADQALRTSEEKLRALFKNSPDAHILIVDGLIAECNPATESLMRGDRRSIIGLTPGAISPERQPDGRLSSEAAAEHIAAVISSEASAVFEWVHRRLDGTDFWSEISLAPFIAGGRPSCFAAIRDITGRKQAEDVLRQSQDRFRIVADFTYDWEYWVSPANEIIYMSPSCERITGYTREEFTADIALLERIIHPNDRKKYRAHAKEFIFVEGPPSFLEFRILTREKEVLFIQHVCQPIIDCDGNYLGRRVSNRDVTGQKKAERQLRHVIAFEELLTSMMLAFFRAESIELDTLFNVLLQRIGEFSGVDRAYLFLYNDAEETVSNKHEWCAEGVAPEKNNRQSLPFNIFPTWIAALRRGEAIYVPDVSKLPEDWASEGSAHAPQRLQSLLVLPIAAGTEHFGFIGFDSLRAQRTWAEEDQQLLRLLADNVALTLQRVNRSRELRLATEAARNLAEAAASGNRAKSLFLANMSHEIRTPMNAIMGFAQVLERDPALTSEQAAHVRTILSSSVHLLNLIDDVLDMSKIEAGRTSIKVTRFCLDDLIHDIETMFRARAEDRGLRLVVECTDEVPHHVFADEGKLRQILINLIGNAVKFTDSGGIALRVRAEAVDVAPVQGVATLRLVAEVEDSGAGISEDDLNRIFDTFQRGHDRIKIGGTGLGLAICRKFVEMMGGTITATSIPGRGTCFRFDVLLESAAGEGKRKSAPRRVVGIEPGSGPYRILLVDDIEDNLTLLHNLLVPVGFEVRKAKNGVEAIKIFDDWMPHAVLMDMRMPIMDGYEATRRLKATAAGQAARFIAVTASAFADSRKEVMDTGMDAYLRKPFQAEELFAALEEGLGVRYVCEAGAGGPSTEIPALGEKPATLPAALVSTMREAVAEGDINRLLELIDQVETVDSQAARMLMVLADQYDYDKLEAWLEGIEVYHE